MSLTRRHTLALLAGAATLPWLTANAEAQNEALKTIAQAKGLRFGNAMGTGIFDNPAYRALMSRECNVLVAENACKWTAVRPGPEAFSFEAADRMFAWARNEGMQIRYHTLLWLEQRWFPKWVNEINLGSQPGQKAQRLLTQHIGTVCGHFARDIYSVDVVNEAVDKNTGELRQNVFSPHVPSLEQVDLAFRTAHEYAPHAQLVYNDYMSWGGGDKHRQGVLKLLSTLKDRGTPVHALGIQSHIGPSGNGATMNKATDTWRRFLDQVTALDLDLLITEFDVNDQTFPADIAVRDAEVAALARAYLDVTLSYPRLRDFLLWGMADDVSWLQSWNNTKRADKLPSRPTPYTADHHPKPLREAIAGAMRAMPQRAA